MHIEVEPSSFSFSFFFSPPLKAHQVHRDAVGEVSSHSAALTRQCDHIVRCHSEQWIFMQLSHTAHAAPLQIKADSQCFHLEHMFQLDSDCMEHLDGYIDCI